MRRPSPRKSSSTARAAGATGDDARLYEQLADHLQRLIERNELRAGERLPSVRRLSQQQGVSVSTVLQAYLVLEDRGLVEARPQSGHYVRRRRQETLAEPTPIRATASATRVSVQALAAQVYRSVRDPEVVPLGAAYANAALLPVEKLNRTLAQVARSSGGIGLSYDPPPGCPSLRRQIARRAATWGCPLGADDVITTIGAMEGLHLCLRAVTRAGDTIAVETPTYFGLLQLIESLGLRVVEIPQQPRTGMDLDALEAVLKRPQRIAAVLSIPSFNNPLGSLMPDEARERLVAMLGRRDIPLIEDDVYGELHFGPVRPRPCKAFDTRGLVLLCGSFTKTLAPGYRVGWTAPGRFRETVEHLKFAQTVGCPTLTQLAVAEFLDGGGYEHHLRQLRRRLATQVEQVREAVAQYFPDGTRVSRPLGGFVVWIELPGGASGLELHARGLARGISTAPGPLFSARQRFENCIRVSAGHPFTEVIEHSLRTLGRLAAELCERGGRGVSVAVQN